MEWIQKNEKMPLSYSDDDDILPVIVTDGNAVQPAVFWKRGNRRGWDCLSDIRCVTHWMPLPEPPK